MYIAQLWRYPVKSLRGEPLRSADVRADGIVGDRQLQVRDADGSLITARTRPGLLAIEASYDGEPRVGGHGWRSEQAASMVSAAAGPGARLVPAGEGRFDDTPLLVATDGCAEALRIDARRLRPSIVVGGAGGLIERGWPGRTLVAGEVEIAVEKLCARCVITTFDPDTLSQDAAVLERINVELGGRAALNCHVAIAGTLAVGQRVELR
jgi:uncharacterized protein